MRLLDFKKIKLKERQEAMAFFKTKAGKEIQREILKKARLQQATQDEPAKKKLATSADIQKIRDAIAKANSLQEVERLTKMLQSGTLSSEFLNDEN